MNATANNFATTVNPTVRGNGAIGATTPMMMMMAQFTACPCTNQFSGAATANAPTSAANNDDTHGNNAETLLSSNAKFQAISAIAVSQDGVINVADQGN